MSTTKAAPPRHAEMIRALAKPFVDAQYANGLAIGLLEGSTTETYGLGGLDENTLVEIGSVTKVFTGLLLAEAVKRGEVTLDQELDPLLPKGTVAPGRDGAKITLRHLATHASGLPRLPPRMDADDVDPNDPYAAYLRADLYADVVKTKLASKPGAQFEYSNYGFGLLGQVLADRAGRTYPELVAERIAKPLGLTRTTAAYTTEGAAAPHDENGERATYWHHEAQAGAGAVRSNVRDLLVFARAALDASAGSALAMTKEQQAAPRTKDGEQRMGLGWHIGLGSGLDSVRWHNGATGGFYAFVAIDEKPRTAVVVLSNTSNLRIDELGVKLVRAMHGQPASVSLPKVVTVEPAVLAGYAGQYRVSPTMTLDVTFEKGRPWVTPTNQGKYALFPSSSTELQLHVVEASIEFTKDGNAVLHQNGDHVATKLPPAR